MRKIFLKIIEAPREHVENRLLIRLADELPSEAVRALSVLDRPLTSEERAAHIAHHALAVRLHASQVETSAILGYLMNENLVRSDALGLGGLITVVGVPGTDKDFTFLLTPLGRAFVEYGRG